MRNVLWNQWCKFFQVLTVLCDSQFSVRTLRMRTIKSALNDLCSSSDGRNDEFGKTKSRTDFCGPELSRCVGGTTLCSYATRLNQCMDSVSVCEE